MKQKTKNSLINHLQSLKYMGYKYIDNIDFPLYDQEPSMQNILPNNLLELREIVSHCNLCNFAQNSNIVFSQGDENAKLIFLNTYSSTLDIQNNQIFTGNTLQLLSTICTKVLNISIEETSILNILKCNPTKDIEDCSMELSMCKPYIQKQLDIIQPKLIVALGDSYNYLCSSDKTMNELREIPQEYNGIKVITTFHPKDILRNPSYKKDVFEDFKKIKLTMEN